jgi:hypothetical protein
LQNVPKQAHAFDKKGKCADAMRTLRVLTYIMIALFILVFAETEKPDIKTNSGVIISHYIKGGTYTVSFTTQGISTTVDNPSEFGVHIKNGINKIISAKCTKAYWDTHRDGSKVSYFTYYTHFGHTQEGLFEAK